MIKVDAFGERYFARVIDRRGDIALVIGAPGATEATIDRRDGTWFVVDMVNMKSIGYGYVSERAARNAFKALK